MQEPRSNRILQSGLLALGLWFAGSPAFAATLSITVGGTFTGAVGVVPIGQACNIVGTCTYTIPSGTPLRITANTPSTAGVISGGTGDAAACGTSTCAFTINTDSSIIVTFNPGVYPSLSVGLAGDGKGEVFTDSNRCQNFEIEGGACTTFYASGSVVTLEGQSKPANLFTSFSGGTGEAAGCSTTPCVFTMTANANVTANFAALGSLSVAPASVSREVGQTQPYLATGAFTGGGSRGLQTGTGSWSGKSNLTLARFGALGVGLGQRFYLVGGIVGGGPSARLESFNPINGSWTLLQPIPTPHSEFSGAVLGGKIYAVGGHTSGGNDVATVEAYDPGANTWSAKASLPAARSAHSVVALGGLLYAVGGGQNAMPPVASLDAYDPGLNTWASLAPMPTARRGLVAAAVGGKLYAFGGDSGAGTSGAVEEYDPGTNAWTSRTPLPTPKAFLSATTLNGLIYALTLDAVEVYNPATDGWTTLDGMTTVRDEVSADVLDGRLWVAGGLASPLNTTPSTAFEAFRPPETTWWSSNRAVATIGQTGSANVLAAGAATISARAGAIDCTTTTQCGTLNVSAALSINDVSAQEGNSGSQTYTFTVTLSAPSAGTVTVSYATQDGTATAGSDYTTTSGTVTFTPGQTSRPIAVSVSGDTTAEPHETFSVALSNPTNAAITKGIGVGVILNDDGGATTPGVSIDDPSVQEGNSGASLLSFTVSLSAASAGAITVNYATSNGTAIAGTDYTASSGTFTIPAGLTSKKLVLVVQGDANTEADETVLVTLTSPVNAIILKGVGLGTIVNDDPPPAATTVTQYRLYHDGTKEHLYTTDLNEYNVLGTVGWIQEGIAYKMLTNGMYGGVATVPLFRAYHPGILQHHWTTDSNEAVTITRTPSWFYEATIGYVVPTQVAGTVPLYRMALASPPIHLWTTDLNEYTVLQGLGWIPEGIIGYVVP